MNPRILSFLLAAGLLCGAAPLRAQTPFAARQAPLALSFDLDGEAADDDQIVVSAQIADSTTYTIAAQPDSCRLVDVTITDANSSISAGVLTIVGTDCYDAPLTATFTFAAGGSGVKTLVVSGGARATAAYFKSVTTISNGVLTGEEGAGTDLIKVGYTSNSVKGWPMYGRLALTRTGVRRVDIFDNFEVRELVKNGAATTDITAVSASTTAPFANVAVGDLLIFNVGGESIPRIVATRSDADTITVNTGITLPTTGLTFLYKKLYFSTDPQDGWIPVSGYDVFTVFFQVDANANTGGVISSVECGTIGVDGFAVLDVLFEEDTATVASAATGTDISSIDLRLKPQYTHCRVSVRFGTGDDADAAAENIDIVVGLRR